MVALLPERELKYIASIKASCHLKSDVELWMLNGTRELPSMHCSMERFTRACERDKANNGLTHHN